MFASLPLTALRAFESAARLLSFKAAAEELSVTPTAISHQIRVLEDWLGVALFERLPRKVRLRRAASDCFAACMARCWKWRKASTPCARNAAAAA